MKIRITILLCLVMILSSFSIAHAQTDNQKDYNIQINPTREIITANKGDVVNKTMSVTNFGANSQVFKMQTIDFAFDSQNNTTKILDAGADTRFSAKSWITFDADEFELPSKESKTISYTISIPKEAESGGHYTAVFAETMLDSPQQSQTSNVGSKGRIGQLILIEIPGSVNKKLELKEFKVKPKFIWKTNAKFDINLSLRNTGDVHIIPSIKYDLNGAGFSKQIDVNNQNSAVMPDVDKSGDYRQFDQNIDLKKGGLIPHIGKLKVDGKIGYDSKTIDVAKTVYVIPLNFIFPALVILILQISLIIFAVKYFIRHRKIQK